MNLTNISLRAKLYILVALMCFFLLATVATALIIIQRVQIGGTTYNGIELKLKYVDTLARTRLNLNLLNSILKSQIMEYDPDTLSGLKTTSQKITTAITEMNSNLYGQQGGISCQSCHNLDRAPTVIDSYNQLSQLWASMQSIIDKEILPALAQDDSDAAMEFFDDELYDHYYDLMTTTKGAVDELREGTEQIKQVTIHEVEQTRFFFILGAALAIIIAVVGATVFIQLLIRLIRSIVEELDQSVDLIQSEAQATAGTSQDVADMATSMAANLQETSSAMEEIAIMVRQIDEHSSEAEKVTLNAEQTGNHSTAQSQALQDNMVQIKDDSNAISSIIKDIESIAFQTNLLALNAAVEAARAGEHGAGFAVVADEVRNLAQRAGESARNSTTLIEHAITSVHNGSEMVSVATESTQNVAEQIRKVGQLVKEISVATHEQAIGMKEINSSVESIDQGNQQLAANAEELAATAETVRIQSDTVRANIMRLMDMVDGHSDR